MVDTRTRGIVGDLAPEQLPPALFRQAGFKPQVRGPSASAGEGVVGRWLRSIRGK
ncbi:hypothetical protein D3C84_1258170 [compost metagenome]